MSKLFNFFTNPFRKLRIGVIPLIRFTSDHLARLRTRNENGEFDERIAATESALRHLINCLSSEIGRLGQRKSSKQIKNQFRKDLLLDVATIHGAVISAFGARSTRLKEFFPKGRSIYKSSPDDVLEGHLENLLDQAKKHEEYLGSDRVAEVTTLFDSWKAIHAASTRSTGRKASTAADRRDARAVLEDELFVNLFHVAMMNRGHPENVGLFMQQHLLERKRAKVTLEPELPNSCLTGVVQLTHNHTEILRAEPSDA